MPLYTLPLDTLRILAEQYGGSPLSLALSGAPVLDFVPTPLAGHDIETNVNIIDEVTARFGLFAFPFEITVTRIDFYCQAHVRNTHLWCAGYTEDGQTQLWNVLATSVAGVGVFTFTVAADMLTPGLYWIAYVGEMDAAPNPDIDISAYDTHPTRTVTDSLAAGVYPVVGTDIVVAHTLPTTFDPAVDLTLAHDIFPQCRFRQV